MPEEQVQNKEKATKGILGKYLNLVKNNPKGVSDQAIVEGIPELQSAGFGGDPSIAINSLRNFESGLNQVAPEDVNSFTSDFITSFGTSTSEVKPTTGGTEVVTPTVPGTQPIVPELDLSKNVVSGFLGGVKANPNITDEDIIGGLNQAGLTQNQDQVLASLKQFRVDLDTQKPEDVQSFVNSFVTDLDGVLKKKEEIDGGQVLPDDFLKEPEEGFPFEFPSPDSIVSLNLQEQDQFLASLPKKEGDPFEFIPPTITREEAMSKFYSSAPTIDQTFDERNIQTELIAVDLEDKVAESEQL